MKKSSLPAALAFALAAALSVSTPAWAQSKKELAQKVVQIQQADFENLGRDVAGQTSQQILQSAGMALSQIDPARREALGKEIQAEVKKFYDSIEPTLRDRAVKVAGATVPAMLEEKMSEDELKQLIAWLESSAAKKFRDLASDIPGKVAEKLVADTRSTIDPKIKALEQAIQKKFEAAAGPAASGGTGSATKGGKSSKK